MKIISNLMETIFTNSRKNRLKPLASVKLFFAFIVKAIVHSL